VLRLYHIFIKKASYRMSFTARQNHSAAWYTGYMKDLVEQKQSFLTYLEIERGRSKKTIENYNRYLERFFSFSQISVVSQLSEELIASFMVHLDHQSGTRNKGLSEPMKPQTKNYYLIALRRFLVFLQQQGIETVLPDVITLSPVPARSLDIISVSELERLLQTPDTKTLVGKRDKALLEVLFSTGLRISELCTVLVIDYVTEKGELLVYGNRGRTRTVFLSATARQSLEMYLSARDDVEETLFVRYGRKAHDGENTRIHPRAVQRLVKQYAAQAGISHSVTPKSIRHSFASDLLLGGASLTSVQALLGHVSIGTTKEYTAALHPRLHDEYKKLPET
jgi:site-specific recombinase XerD